MAQRLKSTAAAPTGRLAGGRALDDLPPPDVLQQEFMEHLEAALVAP